MQYKYILSLLLAGSLTASAWAVDWLKKTTTPDVEATEATTRNPAATNARYMTTQGPQSIVMPGTTGTKLPTEQPLDAQTRAAAKDKGIKIEPFVY
jgi:hypothetical protein